MYDKKNGEYGDRLWTEIRKYETPMKLNEFY